MADKIEGFLKTIVNQANAGDTTFLDKAIDLSNSAERDIHSEKSDTTLVITKDYNSPYHRQQFYVTTLGHLRWIYQQQSNQYYGGRRSRRRRTGRRRRRRTGRRRR